MKGGYPEPSDTAVMLPGAKLVAQWNKAYSPCLSPSVSCCWVHLSGVGKIALSFEHHAKLAPPSRYESSGDLFSRVLHGKREPIRIGSIKALNEQLPCLPIPM